jgi:hypothetical protein
MGLLSKLFGGARRERKRAPPALRFMVMGHGALPSPLELFAPDGSDGKLRGVMGPQPGSEGSFDLHAPVGAGSYLVLAGDAAFELQLSDEEVVLVGLEEVLNDAGEEATERAFNAKWSAFLSLVVTSDGGPMLKDPIAAMVAALDVADRFAALGNGVVMDIGAHRVLVPGTWRVDDPVDLPFDPREHFNLHAVDEGKHLWVHSHGLVKLGKPEIELHTTLRDETVQLAMLDILAGAALADFNVGQTAGDPSCPLHIVDALKRDAADKSHWEGINVLALVDDRAKKGLADNGLRALMRET